MNEKKSEKVPVKQLYKSRKDKVIDGVCGGLAEYLGVDSTLVRILWLLGFLLHGLGLIAYILAMILVPVNPDHKNPKEKKKKDSGNAVLLLGVILIVLGLIFLSQQLGWHYRWNNPFQYFHFWKISWKTIWPLGFILLGILYIVHVFRSGQNKQKEYSKPETKRLTRRNDKKMIAGVCSGIGQYFNVDFTLIRIAFVIMALATDVFVWMIVYIALIIILPQDVILHPNEKK
jgi:phage shock protein C